MKTSCVSLSVLLAIACDRHETKLETARVALTATAPAPKPTPTASANVATVPVATTKRLFLDVHDVGKGKVTAMAVAEAHRQDLAKEGKYGVDFKAYWLDEKAGKIYCLAEAPSAEATRAVHKEAHGLLASQIMEVTADNTSWAPTAGMKLYLDVHHFGAGKVSAKDVAEAHEKDLAAQSKHDVRYLNYWLDEASGTVMCLSQAPSAAAALAVHKEAHGLVPDSIEEVSEGR